MTPSLIGIIGILTLVLLILLRLPVALAMFVTGFVGVTALSGLAAAKSLLASEVFAIASRFDLIVIPLFILMGNLAAASGVSRRLYDAAFALVGARRGGLAQATLLGCGAFSALCGSSLASALTMGKVSLSEMERYNYAPRLATATVAAGGTLGILIPPSTGLMLYAILTEQSIGRLFLAGFLPGLMLLLLFMAAVAFLTWRSPDLAPIVEPMSALERRRSVIAALPGATVILLTIGGLYGGIFSPVESASVGAGLIAILGTAHGNLGVRSLWRSAQATVRTSASIMLILIGAHLFNPFMALSHIPQDLGVALASSALPAGMILGLIILTYLLLGMVMDGLAMLVLTLPVFFPIIIALGYDPIWFGILAMVVLEMGLLSPPVGMNAIIVHSIVPHVPQATIYRGILPFWVAMLVGIVLICTLPAIATLLPNLIMGAS